MEKFTKLLEKIPSLQDQIDLFENLIDNEKDLSDKYKKIVAFSAVITCKNKELYRLIEEKLTSLNIEEQKLVFTASSRMAVTNPYFMAKNVHNIQAGGSLDSIYLRPFPELQIEDNISYHYACISISMINGGYVCFNSHINSLKIASQNDKAIDLALRLVSSIHNLSQLSFNSEIL